jgi:hypothetical protein
MARRDRRRLTSALVLAAAAAALAGCGDAARERAACVRIPAVVVSVGRVRALVDDPGAASPGVARDVLTEAVEAFGALAEAAPRELAGDAETLWDAHLQLSAAYSGAQWKGPLVAQSTAGERAIAVLASEGVARAFERLDAFADARCLVDLGAPPVPPGGAPTTLPAAPPGDEPARSDEGLGERAATVEALGFVLAERWSLAVDAGEASCLGTELLARSSEPDADDSDADYLAMVQATFDACGVQADVAAVTTTTSAPVEDESVGSLAPCGSPSCAMRSRSG